MSIHLYNSDIHYWLAATRLPGIGPVHLRQWIDQLGCVKNIFSQSAADLTSLGCTVAQRDCVLHPDWELIDRELNWCIENHCYVITWADPSYPRLLYETTAAPSVLFVRGDVSQLAKPQIAMVGTRHPSASGKQLAEQFAMQLVDAGFVITSGLALGIDTASHQGALAASGQTIAVFGSGFTCIYPPVNRPLADKIMLNGALVTEFFPEEKPKAQHFPRRNRIISGLSLGVLVVEAAMQSGSLITARFAGEQGRDVFAIPGSIRSGVSRGCHQLIRQGAKLVETVQDIVEELAPLRTVLSTKNNHVPIIGRTTLDEKSQQLLAQIGYEITALDAIIIQSRLTASEVSSMLLLLELEGYVQTVPGGYQRK